MADLDTRIRARLAAFENGACMANERCAVTGFDEMRATLLVVLGLHKPNPVLTDLGPYCEVCAGGYEGVSEWPCETVREIAETLGVEVGA